MAECSEQWIPELGVMELQVLSEFGEGIAAGRYTFVLFFPVDHKELEFLSATETRHGLLGTFPLLVVALLLTTFLQVL